MKWNDEKGWGFLEPTELCTKDYWNEYRELDKTPLGRVLTAIRCGMVHEMVGQGTELLDVGIGGGAFLVAMNGGKGTDVSEPAIEWLRARGQLWSETQVQVMTFWDSIEHILNPGELLSRATQHVFISTPIYRHQAHALSSKHYKPNEHLWYFTNQGIKMFMREYGFTCVKRHKLETDAGREEIGSYAFVRRA